MQTVAKGARLVTTVNLLGQPRLILGPLQKLGGAESLRRLGRSAIDLAHHHVAIQMHVEAQLDDLVRCGPLSPLGADTPAASGTGLALSTASTCVSVSRCTEGATGFSVVLFLLLLL